MAFRLNCAISALGALILTQFAGSGVRAETRALLIGVSNYEAENAGLTDLKGPANDVRLLRDVLAARGVQNLVILADGVEGGKRPSRAAILSSLNALAGSSSEGDLIYIHLSGHGTRQADRDGDESDGLDEVFLAIDTARAEPGSGLIPNAIVDDEIGRAVAEIRAAGADVWLVLDSCHSGTGLRAARPGMVSRYVDPSALGIEIQQTRAPVDVEMDPVGGGELPGGYLAFYAARSFEVAREVNLAETEGGEAWYGLFSSKLAARLAADDPISYRQLFQSVLADLNDSSLGGGAGLQTPSWEGNLIDAPVFGGRAPVGVRRFRIQVDALQAGLVHGLGNGTLMGLVADAASPADALLGFAQVELAEARRAFLRPVASDCTPRVAEYCPPSGRIPEAARFAQILARPLDLVVSLSPPLDAATGAPLPEHAVVVRSLTAAIEAAANAGHALRLDPKNFSVETRWADGRLWFGPRAAIANRPVGLSWDPSGDVPLVSLLDRIAQAETLVRMLDSVAGEPSLLNPSPADISGELIQVALADLAAPGVAVSPARECRIAQGRVPSSGVALEVAAQVKQCDRLRFSAQARTLEAIDVNRVYVDSQFCVRADHALIEGAAIPVKLGPDMTLCSDCPDGYSAGVERAFVIVTEVAPNAEPLNLEGLLDTCGPVGTRGAASAPLLEFLAERARRPDLRGSLSGFAISDIWVERFSWQILPREEAFRRGERQKVSTEQSD